MYIKKTQQRIYLEPVKGKPHDNEVDKKLYKSFVLYFVETYTQYSYFAAEVEFRDL